MTASELKRWLKQRGGAFAEGTNHTFVFFENRRTVMPRHPSKELNPNTVRGHLKKLGLVKDR
ncbi:MAG: type II toxin-antitoxin system HicA family toxin [Bryobacteraceae bacterium]|jgi:mRNA interferase HicA